MPRGSFNFENVKVSEKIELFNKLFKGEKTTEVPNQREQLVETILEKAEKQTSDISKAEINVPVTCEESIVPHAKDTVHHELHLLECSLNLNIEDDIEDDEINNFYENTQSESQRSSGISFLDDDHQSELNSLYQDYTESVYRLSLKSLSSSATSLHLSLSLYEDAPELNYQMNLWCFNQDVIDSGVLSQLTQQQKITQEAIFEIFTSEKSYCKSLFVFKNNYLNNLKSVLKSQHYDLYYNCFEPILQASMAFLKDLNHLWRKDVLMKPIFEIITRHVWSSRHIYLQYSKSSHILNITCDEIMKDREINAFLTDLSMNVEAKKLPFHSFLLLPIQRVTRLPLLLNNILANISNDNKMLPAVVTAFACAQRVTQECNEELERINRFRELLQLTGELNFDGSVPSYPIFSSSRYLILRSRVRSVGSKKCKMQLFLFNDLFLMAITKMQGQRETLFIMDYCNRQHLRIRGEPNKPNKLLAFTLMSNAKKVRADLSVTFEKPSDRERWLQCLWPEIIKIIRFQYKMEDQGKQLLVLQSYIAKQADELTVFPQDVITSINGRMGDWIQGERLRDGAVGWIPCECCAEIISPELQKRNLRLRKRIATIESNKIVHLSGDFTYNESYA